jgi:hypothetical protein
MKMTDKDKFWEHYNKATDQVKLAYLEDKFLDMLEDMSNNWEDHKAEIDKLDRIHSDIECIWR